MLQHLLTELNLNNDDINLKIIGDITRLHHQDYDGKRVDLEIFDKYKQQQMNEYQKAQLKKKEEDKKKIEEFQKQMEIEEKQIT